MKKRILCITFMTLMLFAALPFVALAAGSLTGVEPGKITYDSGDYFDPSGFRATYDDGAGNTEAVDSSQATFKMSGKTITSATQLITADKFKITVTYKDASATFDITVNPKKVTPILTLQSLPNKTTYRVGSPISFAGLTAKYTNESGLPTFVYYDTSGITLTTADGESINNNDYFEEAGKYEITLSYKGLKVKFTLTAENAPVVTGKLTLNSKPNKLSYNVNQAIDFTGFKATYTDSNNITKTISHNTTGVTIETEGQTIKQGDYFQDPGTYRVNVTYKGETVSFDMQAKAVTTGLKLVSAPTKTNYLVNEAVSLSGFKATYTDSAGKATSLTYSTSGLKFTLSNGEVLEQGDKFVKTGTYKVTATYKGEELFFDVVVSDSKAGLKLVSAPTKTTYLVNEGISLSGFKATYTDSTGKATSLTYSTSGVKFTLDSGETIANKDYFTKAGSYNVNVTYKNLTTKFVFKVEDKQTVVLKIVSEPTKLKYKSGEAFDPTGFKATYYDGSKTINLEPKDVKFTHTLGTNLVKGTVLQRTGDFLIYVTYKDKDLKVSFKITVGTPSNTVTLAIKSNPKKTVYEVDEPFNSAGFKATYNDGTKTVTLLPKDVKFTVETGEVLSSDKVFATPGEYLVYVTYDGMKVSFPIKVYEKGQKPSGVLKAAPSSTKLVVNGKVVSVNAYEIDGSNYIKLRDLAKMINGTSKNFDVGWNGSKNAINLVSKKGYTSVGGELAKGDGKSKTGKPNSSSLYIDGEEVFLQAYTINDNNYFKLRDVMQAFDVYVGWNASSGTATLETDKSYQ